MRLIWIVIICYALAAGRTYSLDFKITDVIEVGPIGGGPLYRPARWSPDGSKVAYFRGYTLMVADTLGASREIFQLESQGRNFEWVDDSTIVFMQRPVKPTDGKTFRLSTVTLTGAEEVLEEESTSRFGRPSFSGPIRTPSGLVYYFSISGSDSTVNVLTRTRDGSQATASGHYALKKAGSDLTMVDLGSGERRVVIRNRWGGAVANRDFRYVSVDGASGEILVHDLDAGLVDTVRALAPNQPDGVFCGIGTCEFSDALPLVAFNTTCEDHYDVVGSYICLYDLTQKRSYLVSPLISPDGEKSPVFSSNGRFMSFLASGVGLCIARLEVEK